MNQTLSSHKWIYILNPKQSTGDCLKMSKQRDTGKSLKWYYSRCLLESPRILYPMNASKLLGETWDIFNVSNSILSKSWYSTSSISLAVVGLAVRLCMGLRQTCSLELIWLCCRRRTDMTILKEHRRHEDASDLRVGPRRAWWFSLDASTAAEGVGSEIREKQLWAGALHEELQHFGDQCGKRNYETHRCWLHNWGLSKRSGVAAVVNTVPTWILFPKCSQDCTRTLQCVCTAGVAV